MTPPKASNPETQSTTITVAAGNTGAAVFTVTAPKTVGGVPVFQQVYYEMFPTGGTMLAAHWMDVDSNKIEVWVRNADTASLEVLVRVVYWRA